MDEMIKGWYKTMYLGEIEEVRESLAANHLVMLGSKKEEELMYLENEIRMKEYIKSLEEKIRELTED